MNGGSDRKGGGTPHRLACIAAALLLIIILIPPAGVDGDGDRIVEQVELSYPFPVIIPGEHDSVRIEGLENRMMGDMPYPLPVDSIEMVLEDGEVDDLHVDIKTSEPIPLGKQSLRPMTVSNSEAELPRGSGDSVTPHVIEEGLHDRRGENVLLLSVSPLSYDPGNGELVYAEEIEITVSYRADEHEPQPRNLVDPYELLILACPELEGEFDRLADWKGSLGIETKVVNTSAALGGETLSAPALKSYVNEQHNISAFDHLLLGGGAGCIPAWEVEVSAGDYTEWIPSDHYYGTFNYAIDWTSEIDPYADVNVGRLPFDDTEAAANWGDKLIAYESQEGDEHLEDVLFVGEWLGETMLGVDDWGGDIKDTNEVYVPGEYSLSKLYERDSGDLDLNDVRQALESGAHIVNNVGHGNYDYLVNIRSADVDSINSPMPYIWYSQSCSVGGFDKDPCVITALLGDESNAVSTIANSRFGWYAPGDPYASPSNKFDMAFMDKVFDDSYLLGEGHHLSKETLTHELGDEYMLWVYTGLNLLGDPTLKVGGYDEPPESYLHIDGETELAQAKQDEGWPGDGSPGDPYIIEGYNLRSPQQSELLWISNTDSHVLLRDNTMSATGSGQTAMRLDSVSNVTVDSNDIGHKGTGIRTNDSNDVLITGNRLYHNQIAILVEDGVGVAVEDNFLIRGNGQGVVVSGGDDQTVEGNVVSRSLGHGISVTANGANISGNGLFLNNGDTYNDQQPQAFNDGVNDWSGNFWFLHPGGAYDLAGASDAEPLDEDPGEAPEFDADSLDPLQGEELTPGTHVDFTASSPHGMASPYRLSINNGTFFDSQSHFKLGDISIPAGPASLTMLAFSDKGNAEYYSLGFEYSVAEVSVTITAPDDRHVNNDRISLRWSSGDADNVSYYEVRIDSADWVNVGDSLRYTTASLSEGSHLVTVKAVGNDGNTAKDQRRVFVDTVAPSLSFKGMEEGEIFTENQVMLRWNAHDPEPSSQLSHFTVRVGTSTTVTIADPDARSHLTSPLAEGDHRITLRAYDKAGNFQQKVLNLVVDTKGPVIEFHEGTDHPFYPPELTVEWSAEDEGSEVVSTEIRINRGPWLDVTGETSHTFGPLEDGYYDIQVRAGDLAGHSTTASSERVVATTQAVLDFINPHHGGYSKSPDVFKWDVWDKRGYSYTYQYSVDGGDLVNMGAEDSVELTLENGQHTLRVKATCVETGAVLDRALSFITLDQAQPPTATDPEPGQEDFLFDRPLQATFEMPMLIDKDLTAMTLTDSQGSNVEGKHSWSRQTMTFVPDMPLSHPADYIWSINVVDVAGNELTVPVAFSVKEVGIPGPPQGLEVRHSVGWDGPSIVLDWGSPLDDGGYLQDECHLEYNIYRRTNDTDFERIATVSETGHEDEDLEWDNYYIYYVTAVNPVGEGPASELGFSGLPKEPGTLEKVGLFFEHVGQSLGGAVDDLAESLQQAGRDLGAFIDDLAEAIVQGLASLAEAIVQGLASLAEAIVQGLASLADAIVAGLEALGDSLVSLFIALGKGAEQLLDSIAGLEGTEAFLIWILILLLAVLLVSMLYPSKSKGRTEASGRDDGDRSRWRERMPPAVERRDIPLSVDAALSMQHGELISEEMQELERAYEEGLMDRQEYEREMVEKTATLAAVALSSYFHSIYEEPD